MKKGICHIVGAGDIPESTTLPKLENGDLLICADGGYAKVRELFSAEPDLTVGDFDSLGYIPDEKNTLVAPREKDETDMMLAVDKGLNLGYRSFHIYGALGGERADHSVANLQLLHYISEKGGKGFILHGNRIFTAIKNDSLEFSTENEGYVSVFSLTDKSEGITIEGLKYEVKDYTLFSHKPIGVSNEFIGKKAKIKVESGVLLVSWEENN